MKTTEAPVKPRFIIDQVILGAQKRWRTDIINNSLAADRIQNELRKPVQFYGSFGDDGKTTLAQAIDNLLSMMRHYDGDKDYILSQKELRVRNKRQEAIGFGRAFLTALRGGAGTKEMVRISNLQASLRRVQNCPPYIAESFVRYMKDQKHIALRDPRDGHNNAVWVLTSEFGFSDDTLVKMMGEIHPFFRLTEEQPTQVEV